MLHNFTKRITSFMAAAVLAISNITPVFAISEETTTLSETTESTTETTTETMTETTTATMTETMTETTSAYDENELTHQSIELHPDEETAEKVVTLDGLMPEGAVAEAVDVSEERDCIAAYDISITDGVSEYQPDAANPILVEIADPVIAEAESVELWHIHDDGTREQIFDFTVEEGKISFYAAGFSVYEIVDSSTELTDVKPIEGAGWQTATTIDAIAERGANGFYINYSNNNKSYYVTSNPVSNVSGNSDRSGLDSVEINDITGASSQVPKFYFSSVGDASLHQFYIFVYVGTTPKYLQLTSVSGSTGRAGLALVSSTDGPTVFTLETNNGIVCKGCIGDGTKYYWLTRNTNTPGVGAIVAWEGVNTNSIRLRPYYNASEMPSDPYHLDNVSDYGLMAYTDGSAIGYALMADSSTHFTKMYEVDVRDPETPNSRKTLYVTQNTDITEWVFHSTTGDKYKLSDKPTGKYLKSDGASLSLVDTEGEASEFQVIPVSRTDNKKQIKLKDATNASGKYISYGDSGYTLSTTATALWFVKKATLEESQQVTYTADRISVSDGERAKNGQNIIVYTRIWDDTNKKYDFYAIDYNGSLKQCQAYGDKLMWMGGSINTLLWKFTVYTDGGKENGYYELQNTYSGKYLAPQLPEATGQLLSNDKIGILLPGRKYEVDENGDHYYGEYYSRIMAWDDDNYDYSVIEGVPSPTAKAQTLSLLTADNSTGHATDWYFAVIDPVDDETAGQLHKVQTIDNNLYGIKMKMVDFGDDSKTGAADSTVTKDYFGGWYNSNFTGLLSTNLDENGHPTVANSKNTSQIGSDFGAAFEHGDTHNKGVWDVNNIFIQSVYNSSGYFEYDSCQNFATLKEDGANYIPSTVKEGDTTYYYFINDKGENVKTIYKNNKYYYTDSNKMEQEIPATWKQVYKFTVYRELGTTNRTQSGAYTSKHGQFLPFNNIREGVFSETHKENLYSVYAKYNVESQGELLDTDPRKYEKLYAADNNNYNNTNFYFGMEMEAKFVQTPSGLDAWGHDVIFEFTGDDDFWLYVDKELVLDIGGTHSAEEGKVNFKTGDVYYQINDGNGTVNTNLRDLFRSNYITRTPDATAEQIDAYLSQYFDKDKTTGEFEKIFKDYTEHEMKIYYMERGAGASNLHMRFNLSSVTPGNVLFAKDLSGDTASVDQSQLQFPFQIMYSLQDENIPEADREWKYLTNAKVDNQPSVSYLNSTQTVKYVSKFKSPNSDREYQSVFFVQPNKRLEIHFPDDAMMYQIIECAVNKNVYSVTSTSADQLEETVVSASGNIADLKTKAAQVKQQPTIALNNAIKDDCVHALAFTKRLYADENKSADSELFYNSSDKTKEDKTTFNYRLYLSNGTDRNLNLADLVKYHVLDPEKKICKWDSATHQFIRYTEGQAGGYSVNGITEAMMPSVTFHTSRFGSISNIPAGYTVYVPGLLAGTKFMVVEREYEIPVGYDLIDYECKTGHEIEGDDNSKIIYSYDPDSEYYIDDVKYDIPQNSRKYYSAGTITIGKDAEMTVSNCRGYGIRADKKWTDEDFANTHGNIFTAVYVNEVLQNDTVKCISAPNTSVQYFFQSLQSGKTLADYKIYEVAVVNPVIDSEGHVTSYSSLTKLESLDKLYVTAEDENRTEEYSVSYQYGTPYQSNENVSGYNARKDIIKNTRKGGIEINLYLWNNTDAADTPLSGGTFVLYQEVTEGGNTYYKHLNTYISDSTGNVTVLYNFSTGNYKLIETIAPKSYIGIKEPITFSISESGGNYSLTSWNNPNDQDDHGNALDNDTIHTAADGKNWAEYDTPYNVLTARIDIYNKPYTFEIKKVDGESHLALSGAKFALHREVEGLGGSYMEFTALEGYGELESGAGGIIPKIDQTLPQGTYYLRETEAPDGYNAMSESIRFSVTEYGISIDNASQNGYLKETESLDGSHVTYVISVPNTLTDPSAVPSAYYFGIEKTILLDKYVHDASGDEEQKFVFKVDRYGLSDDEMTTVLETFYVTLNCTDDTEPPFTPTKSTDEKFTYDSSAMMVKVTYDDGSGKTYSFPAKPKTGTQIIGVKKPGIYKITEDSAWSKTDYEFWKGSNKIKDDATSVAREDGAVVLTVNDRTIKTACFLNSETEYAYLTSQAWAENIIKE